MRRKGRLFHSSILTAALFVFAAPAFAAEPAPGDVCANLNYIISTGGPETSGIHRLLRCDGTNWQLMMTIDASGHVGIGNPTPGAALDVLSADTVGDIFPAIFGGSTTEGVTLVVNNWESNHHQAQIAFQDQWYVGNSSLADATDDFYIYNKATTSSPFGISPGNSVNLNAAFALTGDITPAQITANQNDYNPAGLSTASVLRLNSNASRNITSLAGGADGRVITVMNIGSFPIVLKNDDGVTGTAANRFAFTGDLTLAAKQSAMLMYDSTVSRWRQIANGTATGSGDNLGNHIATANIQLGSNWLSGDGGNEGITVDASGKVGIGVVPSFDLDIAVADKSGFLQLANTSSTADRYPTISVANFSGATNGVPTFAMYRARGSSGTPAAVQQWDLLGGIEFQGHDGASSRNSAAKIEGWASESWSATAHGSSLDFATTPNGSTTKAVRLTIGNDGMVSIANAVALTGDITPAQITANQNDYNPAGLAGSAVLRLSSDASRNITSLAGGADGRVVTLMNVGSFPIVLKNDDGATGTAANRFALTGDLTLAAKQSAMLMYDSTASRWRQIANGTATGSGDNLGNHTATQNIVLGSNYLSGDGGAEGIYVDGNGNTTATEDLYVQNDFYVNAGSAAYFSGSIALTGDISPAQITANQTDYNPAGLSTASVLRLNSNASRNITSLAGGADGRVVTLMNVGSFPIVLKNDDGATGTAANRFALTGDLTLAAKQSAMLMYDSTASRWRQIANGTATGSGDNLGNHTATANIQLGSNWLSGDGGNEGLKIDSTGHITVGPGTDASQEAVVPFLYVNTTSDGGISVRDSTANAEQVMVLWGGVAYLGPVTNTPLAFQTNDTERMRIVESGNVGIGTATPADSLHVYEATPGESAGITIGNDGTGVSQQSWLNLVTKGDGSHPLGTAGVQGWQIWANADASTTLGYTGGANGLGIGYTDGSSWNNVALVIQPSDRLGIFNPFPGAGLDAGTSVALSGDISPAQITADKNNYNPTDLAKASVLRLTSDASRTITGIAGGVDGRVLTILNVGSNPIVLSNQNTSSTAANRFAIGANFTISADQSASLIYDSTSQRWRSASLPFSAPTCSVYSYSFPAIASQPGSTLVSSPIIPIATNSCTATVSISGAGSPQFRTCSDAACATVVNDWGSAGQSISNAQYIQARLTTSAVNATDTATLSVGSTLGNFSVDTAVTYKLIFITSALYSGNLGGVSGADAKCASAATAAGLSGTYLAWIADSTDASAPATRFTQASVPYRRKDMTKVANNWTGLTSGTLLADLNMDENGNLSSISSGNYSGQKPFHSNVNANGTRVGTTACTDWSSTSGNGLVGDAKQSGSAWSNSTTQSCSTFATMHVLCVQQ